MARLSVRQKKRISSCCVISRVEYNLIKTCKNNWEDNRLKPLKDRIRKHYLKEQNYLCAYCKLPFRDDKQIEHVVPKDGKYGRSQFMFLPKNLVVACKHCNTKKSTNNDMIPWNCVSYPHSGLNFKIIHPHFDDYFRHIEIVDKSRYVSRSVKGHKTIERCKLYDPVILEVLSEYMQYQDDPIIQSILRIRKMQGDFKTVIDRFLNRFF